MPLSPAPRGGRLLGGQGGHLLTGGAPLHLSLPGFVPLPHSPPISSGNLGRESGLHISLSSFLVARFPDGPSPATPPPSPFFFNHFLHPPLSAPNLAPRTSHTTTPPGGPLTPCTTLPCILAPDAIVGQTVCGYLPVTSGTVDNPPLPSLPRLLIRQPAGMDGPIPRPRPTQERIFCNLQSAICARQQTPVSVVITSMDLHHTTLAQRPGVWHSPTLRRRHCDGAVTTLSIHRLTALPCEPVCASGLLLPPTRLLCTQEGEGVGEGRGERGKEGL